MIIAPIILRIRNARTRFGNLVAGSAELDVAIKNTITKEVAFVVPMGDDCPVNPNDAGMNQTITERFSIVAAIANDSTQKDKTGLTAYNHIHNVRSEFFRAILGWQIKGADSLIYYTGSRFLAVQSDYVWWEFTFEYKIRLIDFDGYSDLQSSGLVDANGNSLDGDIAERTQVSQLDSFDSIYTEYIMWPGKDLPWTGSIPINDDTITQMSTWVNLTDDPNDGAFDRSFASAFDFYKILNRQYE